MAAGLNCGRVAEEAYVGQLFLRVCDENKGVKDATLNLICIGIAGEAIMD